PLARPGHDDATVEDTLRAVERGLIHERVEVTLRGHAVVGALDLPGVDRIPHHLAEALWRQPKALSAAESRFGRARDDFLLRVVTRREILECAPHQRPAFRIVNEASPRPLRRVQVAK